MLWLANAGTSTASPEDDFWYEAAIRALGQGGVEGAMRISAVFRCVRLLGETMGQLPLRLYRRLPRGGKERATEHPLSRLMALQPNSLQTAFEWREMMQGHLELRGYAYSRIEFTGSRVAALWPMHPDRVKVEMLPGLNRLRYTWTPKDGPVVVLNQDEVLHLRGLASDGFQGLNPIEIQRRTLEFNAAASNFGQQAYAADAVQRGWVEHPNNFKDKEAREQYRSTLSRQLNDGKIPILEYGLKYHEVGMKLTDAQFVENRKYSDAEIAMRIFGVPPHKIGILDKATWANIESQNIEFVQEAVLPRARRNEQRYNTTLLSDEEQEVYFFEYDLDGLLRGDTASRGTWYEKMLKNRVFSPNEVRERENMNPAPWGDEPLPMPNESLRRGDSRDDREAQLERGAASAVVNKELHTLRSLGGRLEGAPLLDELKAFYADLPAFVERALAVSPAKAAEYCADSMATATAAAAEGRLVSLVNDWKASRADRLLEIVHA